MKKSRAVPLILLGTISLMAACDRGEKAEIKQSSYASMEDCMSDWGRDERDCRPARGSAGYVGPRYYWFHSGGYPMAIDANGNTRPLPNSYMNRPGATSTAHSTTTSVGRIGSGRYTGGGMQTGGGGHVSRGGFGGFARSFSGGG